MATQWPLITARLAAVLPTLTGWDQVVVYNGDKATGDSPTSYATVGYVDGTDINGTYATVQEDSGFRRVETGRINSQLVCITGDIDVAGMRAKAFGLLDKLDAYIRSDRTLGGALSPDSSCDLTVDIDSISNTNGTGQVLTFSVDYSTVT